MDGRPAGVRSAPASAPPPEWAHQMAREPGHAQYVSGQEQVATALTREGVLVLPAVIDVVTAGRALGLGRTLTHELVRRGEFPVPVLRVGRVYRVPTAGVLKLLALHPPADNAPEHAPH